MQNYQAESLFQPANLAQAIAATMDEEGNCVRHLYGGAMMIPHHGVAQIIAVMGYDLVFIDALHSAMDADNLVRLIREVTFFSNGKTVAVVRVPSENSHLLTYALDAGAAGIIFPFVSSAKQAAESVRKCRYSCSGGDRSLAPVALTPGRTDTAPPGWTAEKVADKNIAVICQIEDAVGVKNAEAIAATPGVSCLMVGPGDLRLSLGAPSKPINGRDEPCYERAVEHVSEIAKAYRKPLVSVVTRMASTPATVASIKRSGIIITGGDAWIMASELPKGLEAIKALTGEKTQGQSLCQEGR